MNYEKMWFELREYIISEQNTAINNDRWLSMLDIKNIMSELLDKEATLNDMTQEDKNQLAYR